MTGADKDYKSGIKNNWRRTIWNRIVERLAVPARDAVVLYLAGAQDLDRAEALRRGFQPNNMIAVERDKSALAALRARGVLCVEGDFSDVVNAWPPDREVHVVFGDFVCGLQTSIAHAANKWINERASYMRAVFAFNLMRGRDPSSNQFRDFMVHDKEHELAKHRGLQLLQWLNMQFIIAQGIASGLLAKVTGTTYRVTDQAEALRIGEWFMKSSAFYIDSYKSNALTFDSLVLRNPYQFLPSNANRDEAVEALRAKDLASLQVRRRVSAALAHRTMRASA